MNELQLSNGLVSIATKINSHKNNIGYSFIEIGKELIRAKEEDIKHGEWQLFLDEINMSRTQAQRHITVTEQYKMGKLPDVGTIGLNAMYEIATLPEEKRQEAINDDGSVKPIREIRELKKENKELETKYKQAEQQAEIERKERERLERENEELANVEPERVEVVPDDYDYIKGNYEEAQKMKDRYKEQLEEMRKELNSFNNSSSNSSNVEKLKEEEMMLKNKISSYEKIYDMQSNLEIILKTIQPKIHAFKTEHLQNEFGVIDEFDSTLNEVISVCNDLKNKLPNKNIIEGEIVND